MDQANPVDPANEMDPVLRSRGAYLGRHAPGLAGLFGGRAGFVARPDPAREHTGLWFLLLPLLALPVLAAALLLPARVTLGVTAMLLILGSPLAVCWMCAAMDRADPGAPRHP